jgi:cathepsin L
MMLKSKFLFLLMLIVSVKCEEHTKISEEGIQDFIKWMEEFGKCYHTEDEQEEALNNFVTNKRKTDEHNKLFQLGLVDFGRALWEHSDMSNSQRSSFLLESQPTTARETSVGLDLNLIKAPKWVNWVKAGLVGKVEHQGLCGSCWAFAAKGVVEAVLRRHNITTPVSAQQMVDCSKEDGGCDGGWPKAALDYLKDKGFASERNYEYKGKDQACSYTSDKTFGWLQETFIVWTNGER